MGIWDCIRKLKPAKPPKSTKAEIQALVDDALQQPAPQPTRWEKFKQWVHGIWDGI